MRLATMAMALLLAAVAAPGPAGAQDAPTLPNLVWLDPPRPAPGDPFLIEGEALSSLDRFRGRAVVLNFWATWCPPCVAEMPTLDRLAGLFDPEDLAVVTMAADRAGEDKIRAFYERIGARNLGVYRDPQMHLARALRVFGLPTTLLIDHDGMVVAQLVGEAEWDGEAALAAVGPLAEAARSARLDPVPRAATAE